MKRTFTTKIVIWVHVVLLAGFLGQQRVLHADESFSPSWNVGDEWTVEAHYFQEKGPENWRGPFFWTYHVAENVLLNEELGLRAFIVEVREKNGSLGISARLWFDAQKFSLIKAELVKVKKGKKVLKTLDFDQHVPQLTQHTLIPFDTPVFPLEAPSDVNGEFYESIGPQLRVKKTFNQIVGITDHVAELEHDSGKNKYFRVECGFENENRFIQYWVKDRPWPDFGINRNMKYFLVDDK